MSAPSRFLSELPEEGVERVAPAGAAGGARADFAGELQAVLEKKRGLLRVLEGAAGGGLAAGARIAHPAYGEGEVLECEPLGTRQMVKVRFDRHGTLTLLLTRADVGGR
jgi:hypothetical protein